MGLPVTLRTDGRETIVGGTGDGKTTLELYLAATIAKRSRQKVVALNPGAEKRFYDIFGESRRDIDTSWPDVQHVAPMVQTKFKNYAKVFRPIIERGNVLILLDELAAMASDSQFCPELLWIYQMGRRRNVGIIAVTQRPRRIPVFTYTMADHLFVGDILGRDLKYIEDLTSQDWREAVQQRKQYEFLYWSRHVKLPPRAVRFDAKGIT